MKYNLVEIDISTFRGFSIGAEHYYGRWNVHNKWHRTETGGRRSSSTDPRHHLDREDITYPLSSKQAAILNKKDSNLLSFAWKRGDEVNRYDYKDDVIERAKILFKELFNPDEDILVVKDRVNDDVFIALDGPKDLVDAINAHKDYRTQTELLEEKYLIFGDE